MTNEEIVKELEHIKSHSQHFEPSYMACLACKIKIMDGIDKLISKLSPPTPKYKKGDILITSAGIVVKNLGINKGMSNPESGFAYELLEIGKDKKNQFVCYWQYESDLCEINEFIAEFGDKTND